MRNITLSNGDEYTCASQVDELPKFITAHTQKLQKEALFEAWPVSPEDSYVAGPLKLWLYTSKTLNPDGKTSNLFCVDYKGVTFYFETCVFYNIYRSDSHYTCKSSIIYDDIIQANQHKKPYGSINLSEVQNLGFLPVTVKEVQSVLSSLYEPYGVTEKNFTKITDPVKKMLLSAKTSLKKEVKVHFNMHGVVNELTRPFSVNKAISDNANLKDFLIDFFYHISIMRSIWIAENKKVLVEDEVKKATKLGLTPKAYKDLLEEKFNDSKAIVKVQAVTTAAPSIIKFRDNLTMFIDKLGKDEKFTYKDVDQLRRYLKRADKELLNLRHLGKF